LNTWRIGGAELGHVIAEELASGMEDLVLSEQQCKAMQALKWTPLCGKQSLQSITMKRAGLSPDGAQTLAKLLSSGELPSLRSMDFGVPASIDADAAQLVAASTEQRRGLTLLSVVHPTHFGSLRTADAVLAAATLRSCVENFGQFPAGVGSACIREDGRSIGFTSADTLATVLKEKGITASSFRAQCSMSHMKLAGFTPAELVAAGASKEELITSGFAAQDILQAGSSEEFTMEQLVQDGLAIELARSGVALDTLMAAGCEDPAELDIDDLMSKMGKTVGSLQEAKLEIIGGSRLNLSDFEIVWLAWSLALKAPNASEEILLPRNETGAEGSAAIAQLLRLNQNVSSLNLHSNNLDDDCVATLAKSLPFSPALTVLRLSNNEDIKADGLDALIEGIKISHSLQFLTLDRDPIPIKQVKGDEVVGTLDLTNKGYGPSSGIVIAKLIEWGNPELDKLVLDRNPLVQGVEAIAQILRCNNYLKELSLDCTGTTPEGAAALAAALKFNTTLEKLLLLMNSVGPGGCQSLTDMLSYNASVKLIDVRDNKLTGQVKQSFAANMRPGLLIQV